MKKIFTIISAVLLTANVFAQSPEKMSYQAVIRNSTDQLVTNQDIGIQISILQGSASGTEVYVETQSPTTNTNGLVSIEIGGTNATVVSGDFSTIDWANGTYFIKTETDPAGGTNYTITGTSQLLSVPYALHAKMAEFARTEADGDTTNEIQTISRTGLTVTLTDGGTYQDSINTYTAGNGIDITYTAISESKFAIGDFAQGGIVFWVDETGEHGLACAKKDQDGGSGIQWYNGSLTNTEAHGDGVYAGEMNTMLIIANQGSSSDDYAAGVCANYTVTENGNIYGDWYLPSIEELYLMNKNSTTIDATAIANGGTAFVTDGYWSSTEIDDSLAWEQDFPNTDQYSPGKHNIYRVRAVRAF